MMTEDFVNELRSMKVTPHVAQNTDGARDRWPHDAPLTAAGGLSRPTFAIANISLSVRALTIRAATQHSSSTCP
jgi:hypothetical protein